MSNDVVIKIENLSKKYIIGHQQQERYVTFRDTIARKFKETRKRLLHPFLSSSGQPLTGLSTTEELWALKDVSFEVKQGERIGIIGRNGAGKTTLLKLLSRITEPTTGRISIKGRVASLLEVGTGFHPELTGRENIFLNGAILGMSKAEIKNKFDEIVAFAEIEKFLDTPVKRYSSGMYVRLAFSVAAHLEPEILLVDEVLAVGDAAFQKKCLGKMEEVGKGGRTIFFVSHNMSAIQSLCNRCFLLQKGHLLADEVPHSAVQLYLKDSSTSGSFIRPKNPSGKPSLISGRLKFVNQTPHMQLRLDMEIFSNEERAASLDLRLTDGTGNPIGFGSLGAFDTNQLLRLTRGLNSVSLALPIDQLAVGRYLVSVDLTLPDVEFYDRVENCLSFEIVRPPIEGVRRVLFQSWGYGSLEIPLKVLKTQKR